MPRKGKKQVRMSYHREELFLNPARRLFIGKGLNRKTPVISRAFLF